MPDREAGNCNAPDPANRQADRVVVGQLVGKGWKATDSAQGLAADGDGRPETRVSQPELQPRDDIRQEGGVDEHGAEPAPQARSGNAVIEAGDGADLRTLQFADNPAQEI